MLRGALGELRMTRIEVSAGVAIGLLFAATDGRAADAVSTAVNESLVAPPPSEHAYIQYGVALAAEIVAFPGPACSDASNPCILGSGGGVVARAGWRPSETLYLGGAYEMSKQDPHELYRLALLQQARAEARRYFPTGREVSPFLLLGVGIGAYGSEWWPVGPVDTWGPSASVGGGIEVQIGGPVLVVSLAYRPMYFHSWVDSSALSHDSGIAHFVGLEASIEAQDSL
jgi:hypothetical protein